MKVRVGVGIGAVFCLAGLPGAAGAEGGRTWRSRLYPSDWSPGHVTESGQFLHDFSYAGYRNGEAPLPDVLPGPVIDVVAELGADSRGRADATAAIQAAVDRVCELKGGTVLLPAGLYRCDGVIRAGASGVVIRGEGPERTRVFFTRSEGMRGRAHITFSGTVRRGAEVMLAEDAPNRSRSVRVTDADALSPGDDVVVGWAITDAFVEEHGMTGTWRAFNGKWRPFFRRRVVAADARATPDTVTLDVPLRYRARIRDGASVRGESGYLHDCGLQDLSVATAVAWEAAWSQHRVHAVAFRGVRDGWVRRVHSFPSPLPEAKGHHLQSGGVYVLDCKRVTVAECRMAKAQNRGGGGDGYLFEISRSSEVLTRECEASGGRHNFIQNWDFGTSGCVWLRCTSRGSRALKTRHIPVGFPAYCEYHHSLAMACLVDQCTLEDGWYGGNRRDWSSGAGATVTQSVYWNTRGGGAIRSWQHGHGYVIGTEDMKVETALSGRSAKGSAPEDAVEGVGQGRWLVPQSLYEDQLQRRLEGRAPR